VRLILQSIFTGDFNKQPDDAAWLDFWELMKDSSVLLV
jgi:hypothetical protein